MKNLFFYCLVVLFIFSACKDKVETPNTDFGYEYFPLEIGKTVVYEADSIVWNDFEETIDTISFFIREIVQEEFVDNEGRAAFKIERSYKNKLSDAWQNVEIWQAIATESTAERVEENVRFIKLAFPTTPGKTWDGNAFIDNTVPELSVYAQWDYTIESNSESYSNADLSFENVLDITQIDDDNLLERTFSAEKYAKNVGLIYKEQWFLSTPDLDPNIVWPDGAKRGFIYTQKIIEHN